METGYIFEWIEFLIELALQSFHEIWNRIIIVYLIYFSNDSVCICHLFILKFKGLIFNLKVMWDKSEHKTEQFVDKIVFLEIFI